MHGRPAKAASPAGEADGVQTGTAVVAVLPEPVVGLEALLTGAAEGRPRRLVQFLATAPVAEVALLGAHWLKQEKTAPGEDVPTELVAYGPGAWSLLFLRWTAEDGGGALAAVEAAGLSEKRARRLTELLLKCWVSADPEAALAAVAGRSAGDRLVVLQALLIGDPARAVLLAETSLEGSGLSLDRSAVAAALARRSLGEALAWMDKVAPRAGPGELPGNAVEKERFSIVKAIAEQLALDDPEKAVMWVLTTGATAEGGLSSLWQSLMEPLMATDPARAAALATRLPASRDTADLATTAMRRWAAIDASAAAAHARTLPAGRGRAFALAAVAMELAGKDPLAARPLLDEIGWKNAGLLGQNEQRTLVEGGLGSGGWVAHSPSAPAFAFYAVLTSLVEKAPMEALGLLEKLAISAGGWGRSEELAGKIVAAVAKMDPAAAAAALAPLLKNERMNYSVRALLKPWAASDPAAAAAWMQQQPADSFPKSSKNETWGELAKGWAASDPDAARQWAATLTDVDSRKSYTQGLAKAMVEADPAGTLAWAMGQGEGTLRAAGGELIQKQPEQAAALLPQFLQQMGDPASFTAEQRAQTGSLLTGAASAFGSTDSAAGVAWFGSMLSDPVASTTWSKELNQAATAFASSLTGKDRALATNWAAELPDSSFRNNACAGLVTALTSQNPDYPTAWGWGASITDEGQRQTVLAGLVKSWGGNSADAARSAIDRSTLAPAEKQALRQALNTPSSAK